MRRKQLFFLLSCLGFFLFAEVKETVAAKQPDTVLAGAYVISVHDINFHDKEYTMRYWLWFLYDNPDFDFVSQVEVPNAKSLERPDIIVDTFDTGQIWVLMKMKNIMKKSWDVDDYPFDKQDLVVHVENTMFSKNSLVFMPDVKGSTFDKELTVDGWRVTSFSVDTTSNLYETAFGDPTGKASEYASFNIKMSLERDAFGLFMKIFIGMYIAFFISQIGYVIDPSEVEPRFGLPVGGLFAAVGNKYIIDSLLPESSSFTLVDLLHSVTFIFILFTVALNAYSLRLFDKGKLEESRRLSHYGAFVVLGTYLVLNAGFVILAIY